MSGNAFIKTNTTPTFGPLARTVNNLRGIRYLVPENDNGGGAGGDGGDGGDKSGKDGGAADKYTPPATKEEFERIMGARIFRERERFADFDKFKADSAELARVKAENATETEKAIEAARNEGRAQVEAVLTEERVKNALDRALVGRTFASATVLLDLDRKQFVKDGKVDADAVKTWVEANSTEAKSQQQSKDRSQGNRDANAGGGSVAAGRDLFNDRRPNKKTS